MKSQTTNPATDAISDPAEKLTGKEVTPSFSEMSESELSDGHIEAVELIQKYEAGLISATDLRKKFSTTYKNWDDMKQRCREKSDEEAITLDPRFEKFHSFLMFAGPRPHPTWSIDRIDPFGPYSPENCRWASRKAQSRNRSNTVLLFYKGVNRPLVEWAERMQVSPELLRSRKRAGWSDEETIEGAKRKTGDAKPMSLGFFEFTPWPKEHRATLEKLYQLHKAEYETRLEFMERYSKNQLGLVAIIADDLVWPEDYEPTPEELTKSRRLASTADFWRTTWQTAKEIRAKRFGRYVNDAHIPAWAETKLRDFVLAALEAEGYDH